MHRRLWLVVGAAAAIAVIAVASAAASTKGASGSRVLAAAPFSQAWANVPKTTAARKAKTTLIFGMEQDVTGFNVLDGDETAVWAQTPGITPVIRSMYINDQNGGYRLDLASKVVATPKTLTIFIKKNANWMWGSRKVPVTGADFVYTWKSLINPKNNAATTTGYSQITGAKLVGQKEVIFTWKPAFADYRDLFAPVLPSKALAGLDFNTFWANCVCGNDGKPVSDGPFYVSNYTRGQGMTLRRNPTWYGPKAKLSEIDWKLITDTNSEIQAMRGGEVDAIFPQPQTALAQLQHQSGLSYSAISGFTQEHLDFQFGPKGQPLLRQPWMRQAIAMGINRTSLIRALYSQIAPHQKPLNNAYYEIGPTSQGSNANFTKWNFAPGKALALMKSHCTGGPSKPTPNNTAIWTCNGQKAEFKFSTTVSNSRRATSAAIFTSQLASIGIKLDPEFLPANPTFFGERLPAHDFDIAEYAWSGSPDPSGFDAIYQCVNPAKNLGGQNYKMYCNPKVDALQKKGDSDLNPETRTAFYEQAAKLVANDLAIFPLYSPPQILVHKTAVKGMENSNNPTSFGPTWNAEQWHW